MAELAADLCRSTNYEAMAIREMMEIMIADAAYSMVDCDPSDLHRLQGEAKAFHKLQLMLTRPQSTNHLLGDDQ